MRWIDFDQKQPTDPFPGWTPWAATDWQNWLIKSAQIIAEVEKLNSRANSLLAGGNRVEFDETMKKRNKLIDDNSSHWGKLKPWLLALSHGKCWFTEGRDICSHMEVEHFRPKKEAIDLQNQTRDGYWWLAFDYSNFRIAGSVPNRKKGGWFPLHQSSPCSTFANRCEESEISYLLDPINQSDCRLLAFNEEGDAIPNPEADDWEKERALKSIERLKLNDHDALPEARRKVWLAVNRLIDSFLSAKTKYKPGSNNNPKETIEAALREIKRKVREDAELSSVAVWCLLFRNEPRLLKLIG